LRDPRRLIEQVVARARAALTLALIARILRNGLVVLAVLVALDWVFRLPPGFRSVQAIVATIALMVFAVVGLRRVLAFKPTPIDVALRIERRHPGLRNRLAALLELESQPGDRRTELLELALPGLRGEVDSALRDIDASSITSWRTASRPARQLALVATLWGVALAVLPSIVGTGVVRAVAPWSAAQWPSSTEVRDMTARTVVAAGTPFAWKAELMRGDAAKERVKVELRIRTTGWGAWQSGWLGRTDGNAFERMQDVPGDARDIEYRFVTSDATTDVASIRCVQAPTIVRAALRTRAPAYLGEQAPTTIDLMPTGAPAVRLHEAVEGSMIDLELTFSRPVVAPKDAEGRPSAMAALGLDADPPSATIEAMPSAWTVSLPLSGDLNLSVDASDADGVSMIDPFTFRLVALRDQAPIAQLVEPTSDQSVLPTAKVPAAAHAEDDFGLVRTAIVVQRSAGASPDQERVLAEDASRVTTQDLRATIDIAALEAGPGDLVLVWAEAEDAFERDGARREPSRSMPRRLRVVGTSEFGEEIAAATAALRQGVLRLGERQAGAIAGTDRQAVQREQAEITSRTATSARQAKALADRVRMNEDRDTPASRLLDEASSLLEDARKDAAAASESATASDPSSFRTPELTASQEATKETLEAAARLLDRDTKSWEASQSIARAAEAIQASQAERKAIAGQVQGKSRDELKPGERAALDRIAQRDAETAQALREASEAIRKQAEELQGSDPAQAAAMQQAAQRAQQEGVVSKVEQSGEQTRSNAMQQAERSAEQALESLARMQEDLDAAEQLESTVLKRIAEELAERLERLVADAGEAMQQVDALGEDDALPPASISTGVERLRRNTNEALDEALRMERRLDAVIRLIGPAIGHEETALVRLAALQDLAGRGAVNEAIEAAQDDLRRALEATRAAAAEAKQDAQREARQRLAERCQALVAQETAIVQGATELVAQEDARRRLVEGRRLALAQDELAEGLGALMADEEIAASEIFGEALAQASASSLEASEGFRRQGGLEQATEAARDTLDTLAGLAGALSDRSKEKDRFAEARQQGNQGNEAGGGGGGGQQGGILPIAELKLLRDLQAKLARRTARAFGEGGDRSQATTLRQAQERLEAMAGRLREVVMNAEGGAPRITPVEPGPIEPTPDEPEGTP
jgi:hypothetical protein